MSCISHSAIVPIHILVPPQNGHGSSSFMTNFTSCFCPILYLLCYLPMWPYNTTPSIIFQKTFYSSSLFSITPILQLLPKMRLTSVRKFLLFRLAQIGNKWSFSSSTIRRNWHSTHIQPIFILPSASAAMRSITSIFNI